MDGYFSFCFREAIDGLMVINWVILSNFTIYDTQDSQRLLIRDHKGDGLG